MRRRYRLLVLTGLAATLLRLDASAQSTDPLGVDPVTLPPALDRVLRDYEAAWEAGDGTRLAALFTEDGFALNNGSMPVKGRSGIAQMLTQPGGDLQLRAFAYSTSDTVGYIIGGYRYPTSTGPGGKYILALRKGRDGRWLIAADMENSAAPMRRP
jgi:ketosteroid isomerase-like protein